MLFNQSTLLMANQRGLTMAKQHYRISMYLLRKRACDPPLRLLGPTQGARFIIAWGRSPGWGGGGPVPSGGAEGAAGQRAVVPSLGRSPCL